MFSRENYVRSESIFRDLGAQHYVLRKMKAATPHDIEAWKTAVIEGEEKQFLVHELSAEEYESYGIATIRALGFAFDYVRTRARLREKWADDKVSIHPFWTAIDAEALMTQNLYEFGVGEGMLVLRASLNHGINVRFMTDSFWLDLTKLFNVGSVTFETTDIPEEALDSKINRELFKHEKSIFFNLIRNAIVFEQVGSTRNGVGRLAVSWPLNSDWNVTLGSAAEALRLIHRINYALYRWTYQTVQRSLKKHAKEHGLDYEQLKERMLGA